MDPLGWELCGTWSPVSVRWVPTTASYLHIFPPSYHGIPSIAFVAGVGFVWVVQITGKIKENPSPGTCHSHLQPRKHNFSLWLSMPGKPHMGLRKCCCLVDTSSNSSLKSSALEHFRFTHPVRQGHLSSCNVLGWVIGEHIKTQGTFKKIISKVTLKHISVFFFSFIWKAQEKGSRSLINNNWTSKP